jgi:tRNA A37 threonylcarbamoyladenosine dehydratase
LSFSGRDLAGRVIHAAGVTADAEYFHRFGGVARLYGRRGLARLSAARVAVVGIGGVGSWAVEALARAGVGRLALVDLDDICVTNVNRQLHALDGQLGRSKTAVMAERARAIHPGCEVTEVAAFFTARTAAEILDVGFDAVVDAIDTTLHKSLLLAECHRRGLMVVTCGGAGGRRDPTRIRVVDLAFSGKDPLLGQVRKSLRADHGFPKVPQGTKPGPFGIEAVFSDEPPVFSQCDGEVSTDRPSDGAGRLNCATGLGTAAHVTACFGLIAAGRVVERLALGGPV